MADMSLQELAEACAAAMWVKDAANHHLGSRIEHIAPGTAVMSFEVAPQHLNSDDMCHGGYIFALADSAFSYASNSHNQLCVAQSNQITYLSPAQQGERLTATAQEVSRADHSGVYDVTVTSDDGRQVALLRALSRQVEGQHRKA